MNNLRLKSIQFNLIVRKDFAIKELRKFIQENKKSVGNSAIHLSKQCIKFLFVLI